MEFQNFKIENQNQSLFIQNPSILNFIFANFNFQIVNFNIFYFSPIPSKSCECNAVPSNQSVDSVFLAL